MAGLVHVAGDGTTGGTAGICGSAGGAAGNNRAADGTAGAGGAPPPSPLCSSSSRKLLSCTFRHLCSCLNNCRSWVCKDFCMRLYRAARSSARLSSSGLFFLLLLQVILGQPSIWHRFDPSSWPLSGSSRTPRSYFWHQLSTQDGGDKDALRLGGDGVKTQQTANSKRGLWWEVPIYLQCYKIRVPAQWQQKNLRKKTQKWTHRFLNSNGTSTILYINNSPDTTTASWHSPDSPRGQKNLALNKALQLS